jgi:hypothetical protein
MPIRNLNQKINRLGSQRKNLIQELVKKQINQEAVDPRTIYDLINQKIHLK